MRLVIQRVSEANVKVDGKIVGKIKKGLLVLVGISQCDDEKIADFMVKKLLKLRIFEDENEKMNYSVQDVKGEILLVSQFTLYGNCKGCNRPDFIMAAKPDFANQIYEYFVQQCSKEINTQTGVFRADMKVNLLNDGPVTIILDSDELLNSNKN